ncbi:hypothetical protein [Capnocytophaga cynodegmi]|uniref:hypothetical protein n=1 Tax=Capnocytophaga cynodegmi TaxID=28189 RepID=UPI001AD356F5|nr:hypothetical protein [Capnocytophaga cynodegmi]GIM53735.1 hypothetical protein CAPN005_03820 [Capnocytophaga cynodegmi]
MKLRVWYGLTKLTKKIVKKPSIRVVFENGWYWKNEDIVKRQMQVLHTRYQSENEMKDAENSRTYLTMYELYIFHDKRFKGDPERAILQNYADDVGNVSDEERELIANKFRDEIYTFYNISKEKNNALKDNQLKLF